MRSLLAASGARLASLMAGSSLMPASATCASRLAGSAYSTIDSISQPSTSESVAPRLPAADEEDVDTFARFGPSRPAPFGPGDSLLPQLCATPKKKLSLHRRGNRRVWYWLKRKTEYAKCSYCGALAGRNHMFSGAAGNSACTGQCVEQPAAPPSNSYPAEYKPPC